MTLQGPADSPAATTAAQVTPAPVAPAAAPSSAPQPADPAAGAEPRRPALRAVEPAAPAEAKAPPPAKPKPAPPKPAAPPQVAAPPIAARPRARHWIVAASFALVVVVPTAVTGWYLWDRAAPRYASDVGFSVRTEEVSNPLDLLGGLSSLGAGTSSTRDVDVLYRFIQSREIVQAIDARLDLRTLWAKGDPDRDPWFAYHPPGTIEDLHDHWNRMVAVYLDTTTGLLDVQVQAFTPEDAHLIAQAIYEESQALINRLSDIAVADTTRLARQQLDETVGALKTARAAITRFRSENQVVDPTADITGQMTLVNELQAQLAQQLIELDLLRQNAPDSDPRVQQALARVGVIEARLADERAKFGLGRTGGETAAPIAPETADLTADPAFADPGSAAGTLRPVARGGASASDDASAEVLSDGAPRAASGQSDYADLVAAYEGLAVEQEFAQRSYLAALANYESALNQGRQQTRYLAAHVQPTLAERSDHPKRWATTLMVAFFAFLSWTVLTLAGYALRDRR